MKPFEVNVYVCW